LDRELGFILLLVAVRRTIAFFLQRGGLGTALAYQCLAMPFALFEMF